MNQKDRKILEGLVKQLHSVLLALINLEVAHEAKMPDAGVFQEILPQITTLAEGAESLYEVLQERFDNALEWRQESDWGTTLTDEIESLTNLADYCTALRDSIEDWINSLTEESATEEDQQAAWDNIWREKDELEGWEIA